MATVATAKKTFYVEVLKPSHYDDNGYVIQWVRALIPSNSLACVLALAEDAKKRQTLGEDVEIVVAAYDECHTVIPTKKIINRIQRGGGHGLIMLTGVQSNQFPRAVDLGREFREAGIAVAIGGFHVSGCLSMLPELPQDLQEAKDLGITLFAGEVENNRLDQLFSDAYHDRLEPVYNYLQDLPDLEGQVTPLLPIGIAKKYFNFTAFDVGRGCPFRCSFCTIINVQGRRSRHRDADDVEALVRANAKHGVKRFFITDDNMARNKNWESIFDRLIKLREEGIRLKLFIQVDTQSHKIPNFIEKAAQAGCNRVFIGMESVSPENLKAAKKYQNNIQEYRKMLQKWRNNGVITHAGYILGFPDDTPESIARDIKVLQHDIPIDILEFFVMTPLPGSEDHQTLTAAGASMDPDMNIYDTEHVTVDHPRMSRQQWRDIYAKAWDLYYTPEHIETLLRRAEAAGGPGTMKMSHAVLLYHGLGRFERVHPLQCGVMRRKIRATRRPSFAKPNPLWFLASRAWETASTWLSIGLYFLELSRVAKRIKADPSAKEYMDFALTPVEETAHEDAIPCETEDSTPAVIPITPPLKNPAQVQSSDVKRGA
jgi:pyruvate-formate lyase-activating enzyme